MIKNIFKLNGKYIDVATSWDDLCYDRFNRMRKLKPDDGVELVSILTNVPRETLEAGEISGLEAIFAVAHEILKAGVPDWNDPVDKIGPYTLPKNKDGKFKIEYESMGQFEDMRSVMNTITDLNGLMEAHPRFVSIYLQKIRDGHYDSEKAKEMVKEVKAMPAREVISLGSFFWAKLRALFSGTPPSSPTTTPSPKKSKPVSKPSTKRSGRTRR